MSKIFFVFLLLIHPLIVAEEICNNLTLSIEEKRIQIKKMNALKEKNMEYYEENKNDFSKKTKIFSNIMIINNKIETLKLDEENILKSLTQSGCKYEK